MSDTIKISLDCAKAARNLLRIEQRILAEPHLGEIKSYRMDESNQVKKHADEIDTAIQELERALEQ